jgi:hypothetical protein
MSSESFLHKHAKELLYNEIECKGVFEWKTDIDAGFESLTDRLEYRKECILMEFPSVSGNYPDECACLYPGNDIKLPFNCKLDNGYRWNDGKGYCRCTNCQFLDLKKVTIHDIAAFWKGNVAFAIEIINKHAPSWKYNKHFDYPVFLVDASNVLKRVSDTPVFVSEIIK